MAIMAYILYIFYHAYIILIYFIIYTSLLAAEREDQLYNACLRNDVKEVESILESAIREEQVSKNLTLSCD